MSRLAKKPILIPQGTQVSVSGRTVTVKGPKGELTRDFRPSIALEVASDSITLTPKGSALETRALWGTYAAHLKNMIKGVNTPYEKKLVIEGIGFKAEVKGIEMVLNLGFLHPVKVAIPSGLAVKSEKGVVTITGINKESVGSFAAEIRSLKKPEPYKGKGIRYEGEVIKRKQGKKAGATTA